MFFWNHLLPYYVFTYRQLLPSSYSKLTGFPLETSSLWAFSLVIPRLSHFRVTWNPFCSLSLHAYSTTETDRLHFTNAPHNAPRQSLSLSTSTSTASNQTPSRVHLGSKAPNVSAWPVSPDCSTNLSQDC